MTAPPWIELRSAAGMLWAVLLLTPAARAQSTPAQNAMLPDAPSALLAAGGDVPAAASGMQSGPPEMPRARRLRPCRDEDYPPGSRPGARPKDTVTLCREENPLKPVVSTRLARPLTSNEKGELAIRDFLDPFNFLTIAAYSGVAIAANSHSAYGPGFKGFGRLTGYGLAEDARGEFFETYAIPSLVHEDPRYHRMPGAPFKRRLWHAIEHTYVSHHDDGRPMPNYATLLTYPIGAELSDLYIPGIQTDLPSTVRRAALGIAADPAGALVAEFLPDVASHIHVHIVFVQEILNRMVIGAPSTR